MGQDKKRDKKRDKKALSTVYEDEDVDKRERKRERSRSVRECDRGTDRRRNDYPDPERVTPSEYTNSHATSRRSKDTSEVHTAKKSDSRRGPPPSKSAGLGFADPDTPRSVVPSIASISPENHKSVSVVNDEVYERDRRSGRDDRSKCDAVVDKFRAKTEERQGSLSREERDERILRHAQDMGDRAAAGGPARTPSRAPTAKSHTSRATQGTRDIRDSQESRDSRNTRDSRETRKTKDTRDTRESSQQKRAESVAPSSRGSHGRRSTAERDRSPVRRGTSSWEYSSTTLITISGDANVAIHDHEQGVSTYISSSNSGRQHNVHRPPSFSSHHGDTPRYRPLPPLHPQLMSQPRIKELDSETAVSYDSRSTAKPSRSGSEAARYSPFENSDSGAKTITSSEASRFLGRPAASLSGYSSLNLEPVLEIREPRGAESLLKASSTLPSSLKR
ncbi:hypothetical protein BPAE_0116g00130 [Botrytis paeoniae]|uniref:Uncharacterized protein n=1 Tax=Botrytis paeoniae TaxID=278948 RepID=A0A4Z1FMA5_9HELO|nr:hypothetical protein BPAE_0116g00130 [Botrytis paeoniae]